MDVKELLVLAAVFTAASCEIACDSAITTRNLALDRPAYHSSTYGNRHHAFLAVDGSTTAWEGYYSCSITNYDQYAWWSVDLGSVQTVTEVYITGRADCCPEQLKDFYVGVTDTSPTDVTPTPSPVNYDVCYRRFEQVPQGTRERIICDNAVSGRYLIVQLAGSYHLSICSVEVYSDSYLYDNNLAMGGQTWQSSLYSDQTSNYAVDGFWGSFTFTAPYECTHTDYGQNSWWAVDLGSTQAVGEVWIQNREDCCSERLSDFFVGVTDDSPETVVPNPFPNPTYSVCYHYTGQQFNVGTRAQIICNRIVSGRYLIVQLGGSNYLTLCEVEVYAGQ